MNPHHFLPFMSVVFSYLFGASTSNNHHFSVCNSQYFNCKGIQGLRYPFWGQNRPFFCGHWAFNLTCLSSKYTVLTIGKQSFYVLSIDQVDYTITLVRKDLWGADICDLPKESLRDTIFHSTIFRYTSNDRNLTLMYGCPEIMSLLKFNFCMDDFSHKNGSYNYYADDYTWRKEKGKLSKCRTKMMVPINQESMKKLVDNSSNIGVKEALGKGFELEYFAFRKTCIACEHSGGHCGSNLSDTHQFQCHRYTNDRDLNQPLPSPGISQEHGSPAGQKSHSKLLGEGIAMAGVAILVLCVIVLWLTSVRKMKFSNNSIFAFWKLKTEDDKNIKLFIKKYESIAARRYSYSDVKKMTKSFKNKLGDGGYGSVYKGKLPGGHLVAVKVLNVTKGNGEEFINEVASISQTSHVNIVSLLGFCFEGQKRALIYEFMSNGSLEKYLYNDDELNPRVRLGWEDLYRIAIRIAQGLEYLHRGCNTRILHFDIKPHNILLDEDFCPKIADFGLAKLCSRKESAITIGDTRGTIGYIAPEVYSRNFGKVSHKSDVYSYGVMILEMVSGRRNINVNAEGNASSVYFPHWVYERLELGNDLGLNCALMEYEDEIAKKMVLVGLWCIQTNPTHRPSMNEVMLMFEASIHSLRLPPKSFMFSPSNS